MLKELGMNVNFKSNNQESDKVKIPIDTDLINIELKKGLNVIELPIKTKLNETNGLPNNGGLYTVKEGKVKIRINSHDFLIINPEPMEIDENFEIVKTQKNAK
jgi:hypothetical protein